VGSDGEVVVEVTRVRLQRHVGEPHGLRDPLHPLVGAEVGQQQLARRLAAPDVQAGPTGQQLRLVVRQQEDVGLDDLAAIEAEAEDAQRHPRLVDRHRHHDRGRVARALAELARAVRVEARRHEDRGSASVEVEHLGGVGRQQEPVLDRPLADRVAATPQHGDVERVDLGFEENLGVARAQRCAGRLERSVVVGHRDLLLQALQGPVAAALDLGGDGGQRHDRPDLLALAGELEGGHVALYPVVVGGERRGAHQLDGAVLTHQPTART
jgi:hypothetical protein